MVGQLGDLEASERTLLLRGETVHLVFRKFSTQSLRLRLERGSRYPGFESIGARALWETVSTGGVCLVNPLGSTLLQDKALMELMWKECPDLREQLPRTVLLEPRLRDQEPDLFQCILGGEDFVLKRRISYGGKQVILDPERIRLEAPRILREEPGRWVAQSRVRLSRREFAAWDGQGVRVGIFPFVLGPFGRSCFVRVGLHGQATSPVNAHAGSAATFLMTEP